MAIRFRRVSRLCDPTNKELGKKVYPVISYQYDTSATLKEIAKEISSNSGVSEGETISVLKDFRTLLRKTLLAGGNPDDGNDGENPNPGGGSGDDDEAPDPTV